MERASELRGRLCGEVCEMDGGKVYIFLSDATPSINGNPFIFHEGNHEGSLFHLVSARLLHYLTLARSLSIQVKKTVSNLFVP